MDPKTSLLLPQNCISFPKLLLKNISYWTVKQSTGHRIEILTSWLKHVRSIILLGEAERKRFYLRSCSFTSCGDNVISCLLYRRSHTGVQNNESYCVDTDWHKLAQNMWQNSTDFISTKDNWENAHRPIGLQMFSNYSARKVREMEKAGLVVLLTVRRMGHTITRCLPLRLGVLLLVHQCLLLCFIYTPVF